MSLIFWLTKNGLDRNRRLVREVLKLISDDISGALVFEW